MVENITINNQLFSRVKINKKFVRDAEKELNFLIRLQGAPIIPRIFAYSKNNENLWILVENLSGKPDRNFTQEELLVMMRDSAITLRIIEGIQASEKESFLLKPITPKTCLFDSDKKLKYLGIGHHDNEPSILASLFSSIEKIKDEAVSNYYFSFYIEAIM